MMKGGNRNTHNFLAQGPFCSEAQAQPAAVLAVALTAGSPAGGQSERKHIARSSFRLRLHFIYRVLCFVLAKLMLTASRLRMLGRSTAVPNRTFDLCIRLIHYDSSICLSIGSPGGRQRQLHSLPFISAGFPTQSTAAAAPPTCPGTPRLS